MQVLLVPSAFTKVTGEAHWEVLLRARAIETQCYVITDTSSPIDFIFIYVHFQSRWNFQSIYISIVQFGFYFISECLNNKKVLEGNRSAGLKVAQYLFLMPTAS